MSELIQLGGNLQTMTSCEIAKLTGQAHFNVLTDIRKMFLDLGEDALNFQAIYRDSINREQSGYLLHKRETLILVSGYSVAMRAKIIDRWQELEARVAPAAVPNLRDPKQLAAAALQLIEVNQELQAKVETMKVVVAAHERIALADSASCVTDAAKTLQMRPMDLFSWLSERRWIYRRRENSVWLAYQDRIQQGVLKHKVTTIERRDGGERVVQQVLVTSKGLARLAEQVGILALPTNNMVALAAA